MSTLPPPNHHYHEAHHAHAHPHHLMNHHHSLGCTCQCTRHCFQHCKQLKRQKMNQYIVAQTGDTSGGAIGPLASTALIGMSQMNQPISYHQNPSYQHSSNQRSMGSLAYQPYQHRSPYSSFAYQQPHSATYQPVPMSHQRSVPYQQVPVSQKRLPTYQKVPMSQQCPAAYQQVPVSPKSFSTYQQNPFLYQSLTNPTNLQGSSNAYPQSVIHWVGRQNPQVNPSVNRLVNPFSNSFTTPSVVNTSVNVSVNPSVNLSVNSFPNSLANFSVVNTSVNRSVNRPVIPSANSLVNPFPNSFTKPSTAVNTSVSASLQEVLRSIRTSVIMSSKSNAQGSSRNIVTSVYPLIIKSVNNPIESVNQAKDQLDFDYRNSFEDVSDADDEEDYQKDGKLVIDVPNHHETVPADDPKDSQLSESKNAQADDLKDAQVDVSFIDSQESESKNPPPSDPNDSLVDIPFIDPQADSIVVITKPPEANYLSFEIKDSMMVILDPSTGSQANQSSWKVAQNDPTKLKLVRQADDPASVNPLINDPSPNPLIKSPMNSLVKPSANPSPDSTTTQLTNPTQPNYLGNRREYKRAQRRRTLATETPKQREARLEKQRVSMRKFYRNRRANESAKQKVERFEYARKYREMLKMRKNQGGNK